LPYSSAGWFDFRERRPGRPDPPSLTYPRRGTQSTYCDLGSRPSENSLFFRISLWDAMWIWAWGPLRPVSPLYHGQSLPRQLRFKTPQLKIGLKILNARGLLVGIVARAKFVALLYLKAFSLTYCTKLRCNGSEDSREDACTRCTSLGIPCVYDNKYKRQNKRM
jgi:hypothetical protein